MKRILLFIVCLSLSSALFAQKESSAIRRGNSSYRDSLYEKAELDYRRAIETNSNSFAAQYNLGNALYRQNDSAKYENALRAYGSAARLVDGRGDHEMDSARYSKAMYNMGNCYQQLGQTQEAIDAYKEALRKNPKDEEARTNLAKLLKYPPQQQSQQQQQQQQQQEQEEQEDDQMDQETAAQLLESLDEAPPTQPRGEKRPLEKNW